jgi:hypothetical protein
MSELLSLETPPNAVVCINNYSAFGALKAIHEYKWKIPEEIGIVTFDQYPLAAYTTPPLTSLNIDTFKLGDVDAAYPWHGTFLGNEALAAPTDHSRVYTQEVLTYKDKR